MVLIPQKHGIQPDGSKFIIEQGQSLGAIARSLAGRNIIISRYIFVAYAIFSGHERDFKAGRYLIPQPVNIAGLVNMFSKGLSEAEDIVVTIPEGINVADIDRILAQAGLIEGGVLLANALGYEGYLFPDTYHLHSRQLTEEVQPQEFQEVKPLNLQSEMAQEIIKKMRDNFETKTLELFEDLNSLKVKEVIIVASILEKEVRTEQDMRLVAGIIEKRQELGMALEIDATVAYGVCRQKFLFGSSNTTLEDSKVVLDKYCDVSLANIVDNIPVDSAYNTYKRKGLPAGPISNPGLKAISAALNPQLSDYLFYLSAKDGTTIFSKTAAEHIRARTKYLKL